VREPPDRRERGEIVEMKSDCIILDAVVCTYHRLRPREISSRSRELWLEKIDAADEIRIAAPCVNRWSRA
jgi:hypothetical protein